jgi:purine-nucleoside phosphorylase
MAAEDIIIHPIRGKKEPEIASDGLFLVTPAEANQGHALLQKQGGKKQFLYNSTLTVSGSGDYFVAGPSVGAPLASMTMEKLIALGAKRIILFGWCGVIARDLEVGDIVIGGVPFSGEGTSKYYDTGKVPLPSIHLSTILQGKLEKEGLSSTVRNVWSTDAPYRENRIEIEKLYVNEDVSCVDMEYSALCAVAAFRAVEFAAVFLVSDELYRSRWKPGFTSREFRDKSSRIVGILSNM